MEILKQNNEAGTLSIKTNRRDIYSVQIYYIYKQCQEIEQFFKTYDDTFSFDDSYLRNDYSMDVWVLLSLGHSKWLISTIILKGTV